MQTDRRTLDMFQLLSPPLPTAVHRQQAGPVAAPFTFFLGVHHANWLEQTAVPLFVSRRTLALRRTLPRARGPWALDSGGFTELSLHGRFVTPLTQYVDEVRRFARDVGGLAWAAIQDWMCEPEMVRKTGLDVAEHQRRTIVSFLDLKALAPEVPWVPVLQGWTFGDYEQHVEDYARAGVRLQHEALIGVGSVCRRQNMLRSSILMTQLASDGLRLHGFGVKATGLRLAGSALTSADSMAWSFKARRDRPLSTCVHRKCTNCLAYALEWRKDLLESLERR